MKVKGHLENSPASCLVLVPWCCGDAGRSPDRSWSYMVHLPDPSDTRIIWLQYPPLPQVVMWARPLNRPTCSDKRRRRGKEIPYAPGRTVSLVISDLVVSRKGNKGDQSRRQNYDITTYNITEHTTVVGMCQMSRTWATINGPHCHSENTTTDGRTLHTLCAFSRPLPIHLSSTSQRNLLSLVPEPI